MKKNVLAENGFIHVMGPSPAIVPGEKGAWDDWILECCDILKDDDTYYWYWHARGDRSIYPKGYRVGVATAPTPLGPWTRYEGNPILDYGAEGDWDSHSVDCVCVMKTGASNLAAEDEIYYMWYSAGGPTGRHIGLATASSPVGPWTKHKGNPVIEDFGYLGSVQKVDGKFYMFAQYPVDHQTDQGPFVVATAEQPEGPWTKYDGNPILEPGDWGAWDDGGYSEAGVRHNEGVFHWFYGGTKTLKLESIGYAYSFDGYNWTKYPFNPVIPLTRVPDASGFAEVKHLIEPPFVYIYHTLRYFSDLYGEDRHWSREDLAIQVLSTTSTFRLPIPILTMASLGAGQDSGMDQGSPVSMENASGCALTIQCTFAPQAKEGLRLHIRSTHDGLAYDSEDLYAFDLEVSPGQTVQKTVEMSSKVRFFRVICENLDASNAVSDLQITATVAS